MGFSTANAITDQAVTAGQTWDTLFLKTTGATAYTAGGWYDISMCLGTPYPNIYAGGVRTSTALTHLMVGNLWHGSPVLATVTGTTYAVNSSFTLTDSSNGFLAAGFQPGMTVTVSGFSYPGNNGTDTILTVTAGTITFVSTVGMIADPAGDTVTITNAYTTQVECSWIWSPTATATNSVAMLCDFLMFYTNFDGTNLGPQTTTTNIALPRYPTGLGVQMFMVYITTIGTYTPSYAQVTYTNSSGVTGRKSQWVYLNAAAVSTFLPYTGILGGASAGPFIPLQAGDAGVQSVQSLQFTYAPGVGTLCIVLAKPLLHIAVRSATAVTEKEAMTDTPIMPRVMDGAYLNFLYFAGGATVSAQIGGGLRFNWGNS